MNYKFHIWTGTAFLVSPDEAITVAHNKYFPKKNILSTRMILYVYEKGEE